VKPAVDARLGRSETSLHRVTRVALAQAATGV
jgi:hypothetical protein